MAKKCPDFINDLNDYLDGTLDPQTCEEISRHVGECRNCRITVDSLRQTVTLCRDGIQEPLPSSLESKLNNLLKERWDRKFGSK